MSKSGRAFLVIGLAVGLVGLAACAKPPQAEIDQLREAMASASQAEAPTYAVQAWETAQQSMNTAMAEIEAQKGKFALLRSYKTAGELLASANGDAVAAQTAAVAGKEAARAEVERAITAIEAGLAQADELVATLQSCRTRPKGFASDLEILRGNVDGLRGQLPEVQATAADQDFLEAKSLASELERQIGTVITDLENARTKLGC